MPCAGSLEKSAGERGGKPCETFARTVFIPLSIRHLQSQHAAAAFNH